MDSYRSVDGSGNNLTNPDLGRAGEPLIRVSSADYGDGIATASGSDRPSARELSNKLYAQTESQGNSAGLSDFIWLWGQFIDHDITQTSAGTSGETANISVPTGDPYFDPLATGTAEISLTRSAYDPASGTSADNPREQTNQITPFIDASNIYGSDAVRLAALRDTNGKLIMSNDDLMGYNSDGLPNDPSDADTLFLAGDMRANENVGLTSLHTLFAREHNRLVDELAATNPNWDGDKLFNEARIIVEAELQIITYNEFLPHLLGENAIADWSGYRADVDPQIANEFATAAYRLGHTMLSSTVWRVAEDGSQSDYGNMQLRDAFFRSDRLSTEGGIDDILRGAATGTAETVDLQIVDDVRNFLFGPPGSGGFDLAALNIQRGRDHGLNDYNSVREAYGLERAQSFSDITSDTALQAKLAALYGSVDDIDLYVGGLAEAPVEGSQLGELFQAIVVDQFVRLRDGDRYWYENQMTETQLQGLENITLEHIIERNTDIENMQNDVFAAYERIAGTDESDILTADNTASLMLGLKGGDFFIGSEQNDQMEGGAGVDWLLGFEGDDTLYGDKGGDILYGLNGNDWLEGNNGHDALMGGDGDDVLHGGRGNDHLEGGAGHNTFIFSRGEDTVIGFNIAKDTIDFSQTKFVSSAEELVVEAYETGTLLGDGAGNSIWLDGVTSAESINMYFGETDTSGESEEDSSVLFGTKKDDLFTDTVGTQYMIGGGGTDTVQVSGNRSDFSIDRTEDGEGYVMWTDAGHDIFWEIEYVQFDDELVALEDIA